MLHILNLQEVKNFPTTLHDTIEDLYPLLLCVCSNFGVGRSINRDSWCHDTLGQWSVQVLNLKACVLSAKNHWH